MRKALTLPLKILLNIIFELYRKDNIAKVLEWVRAAYSPYDIPYEYSFDAQWT